MGKSPIAHPQVSRYLVTGAAGFIGLRLCRFLSDRGQLVRALLRRPCDGPWQEHYLCDLAAQPLPEGLMDGVGGVFHLAGIAHSEDRSPKRDDLYLRVNLEATGALLEAAARAGVQRFVYFSSVKAARDPGNECVDETWTEIPNDSYGRSKWEAERLVLAAGRESGMHVCNLRPALVYGSGVKGNLAQMIQSVRRGAFPPLPEFGNRRSMVGLDNLIDAAWLAITDRRANGRTYIVSDMEPYSTRALYVAICEAIGRTVPNWVLSEWILRTGARIGDLFESMTRRAMPLNSDVLERLCGSACYRSDRLRAELGWEPHETLFDAIRDMVVDRENLPETECRRNKFTGRHH